MISVVTFVESLMDSTVHPLTNQRLLSIFLHLGFNPFFETILQCIPTGDAFCGKGRIRTSEAEALDLQSSPFDHSGTFPFNPCGSGRNRTYSAISNRFTVCPASPTAALTRILSSIVESNHHLGLGKAI